MARSVAVVLLLAAAAVVTPQWVSGDTPHLSREKLAALLKERLAGFGNRKLATQLIKALDGLSDGELYDFAEKHRSARHRHGSEATKDHGEAERSGAGETESQKHGEADQARNEKSNRSHKLTRSFYLEGDDKKLEDALTIDGLMKMIRVAQPEERNETESEDPHNEYDKFVAALSNSEKEEMLKAFGIKDKKTEEQKKAKADLFVNYPDYFSKMDILENSLSDDELKMLKGTFGMKDKRHELFKKFVQEKIVDEHSPTKRAEALQIAVNWLQGREEIADSVRREVRGATEVGGNQIAAGLLSDASGKVSRSFSGGAIGELKEQGNLGLLPSFEGKAAEQGSGGYRVATGQEESKTIAEKITESLAKAKESKTIAEKITESLAKAKKIIADKAFHSDGVEEKPWNSAMSSEHIARGRDDILGGHLSEAVAGEGPVPRDGDEEAKRYQQAAERIGGKSLRAKAAELAEAIEREMAARQKETKRDIPREAEQPKRDIPREAEQLSWLVNDDHLYDKMNDDYHLYDKMSRAYVPEEVIQGKEGEKPQQLYVPEELIRGKEGEKPQQLYVPEEVIQEKEGEKPQQLYVPEEVIRVKEGEKPQQLYVPEEVIRGKEREKPQQLYVPEELIRGKEGEKPQQLYVPEEVIRGKEGEKPQLRVAAASSTAAAQAVGAAGLRGEKQEPGWEVAEKKMAEKSQLTAAVAPDGSPMLTAGSQDQEAKGDKKAQKGMHVRLPAGVEVEDWLAWGLLEGVEHEMYQGPQEKKTTYHIGVKHHKEIDPEILYFATTPEFLNASHKAIANGFVQKGNLGQVCWDKPPTPTNLSPSNHCIPLHDLMAMALKFESQGIVFPKPVPKAERAVGRAQPPAPSPLETSVSQPPPAPATSRWLQWRHVPKAGEAAPHNAVPNSNARTIPIGPQVWDTKFWGGNPAFHPHLRPAAASDGDLIA